MNSLARVGNTGSEVRCLLLNVVFRVGVDDSHVALSGFRSISCLLTGALVSDRRRSEL